MRNGARRPAAPVGPPSVHSRGSRTAWRLGVLATLLGLATAGSARAAPAAGAATARQTATLLHWWTAPSELAAVGALGEVLQERHPELVLSGVDARSHGGGARIFQVVSAAVTAGDAPEAVLMNAGAPLQPYFDAGLLTPLDDLWQESGLESVVPTRIREMSRIGTHYYALPIDVHRNNLIWYNARLLDAHGIDPATLSTWRAVFEAADRLRDAGVDHPLQVGVPWTASLAFEGIVAGLGATTYRDWVNGRITAPGEPRVLEAFETLGKILSYATPDHAAMSWDAVVRRVARGEAAFCIMGDWANGEFRLAGLTYGDDYGAVPMPGTEGMYGVAVDSFVRPMGAASAENSERLLRVAASPEGQDAFNSLKGSVPPRSDAGKSGYDLYQRSAIAALRSARTLYPNIAGATHDSFKSGLDAIMGSFQADRDVRRAAAALAALTQRTQKRFTRVWSIE